MAGSKTAQELIDEQYQKLIDAQKAKSGADYDANRRQFESELAKAGAAYQPLRNEAYVNNALAERARKENVANMGMSGEGGTSMTLQQRNTNSLLSSLGDISRQQRGYEDELSLALRNLDASHTAELGGITAELEAKRLAAQLSQLQADQSDALDREKLALSREKLALSQQDDQISRYYQLYKARMITKKQFEQATGIDLK